jgi:hypothetical protein
MKGKALKSAPSRTIHRERGKKANYLQQDRRSARSVMGIGDATRCDEASVSADCLSRRHWKRVAAVSLERLECELRSSPSVHYYSFLPTSREVRGPQPISVDACVCPNSVSRKRCFSTARCDGQTWGILHHDAPISGQVGRFPNSSWFFCPLSLFRPPDLLSTP